MIFEERSLPRRKKPLFSFSIFIILSVKARWAAEWRRPGVLPAEPLSELKAPLSDSRSDSMGPLWVAPPEWKGPASPSRQTAPVQLCWSVCRSSNPQLDQILRSHPSEAQPSPLPLRSLPQEFPPQSVKNRVRKAHKIASPSGARHRPTSCTRSGIGLQSGR